jgi:hypothetical protein
LVEGSADEVLDARVRDAVGGDDHGEQLEHLERGEVRAEGEDVLARAEMVVGGATFDVAGVVEQAVAFEGDIGGVELVAALEADCGRAWRSRVRAFRRPRPERRDFDRAPIRIGRSLLRPQASPRGEAARLLDSRWRRS